MPASQAPRHALRAALKPIIPETWKIIPYQRDVGVLSQTIVMFKQGAIRPLPAAPIKALQVDMTATIVSPLSDTARAEDELDDDVLSLTFALDELGILWTEARKVLFNDSNLAYDIDIQLEASKKAGNPA
jgi:hypothetical protein